MGVERDRQVAGDLARAWAPAGSATPRLLEQQQAELDALLDTMPGWVRLAREIVNDD